MKKAMKIRKRLWALLLAFVLVTQTIGGVFISQEPLYVSGAELITESPVLDGKKATFYYKDENQEKDSVKVAGSFTNWASNAVEMTYDAVTQFWSCTIELTGGTHEYKLVVDGDWITDPLNTNFTSGGNSMFIISSTFKSPIINSDNTVTFNLEADGEYAEADEVYLMGTLTDWSNGVKMTKQTVDETVYFTVTLDTLKPGTYSYKFRIITTSGQVLWITDPLNAQKDLDGNSKVVVPGMMISGDNPAGIGSHNFKAMFAPGDGTNTDYTEIATWSLKTDVEGASIEDGVLTTTKDTPTGELTIVVTYIVDDVQKVQERTVYYTKRALIYQYETTDVNPNGDPDIYVWYNSPAENIGYSFKDVNGFNTAYVTASDLPSVTLGYIIRLYGDWGENDREFGDRTVTLNSGEAYTKVKGKAGQKEVYVLPSGKTYYNKGIIFNYRDDQLFYENKMDTIESVSVNINGTDYPMTYSEKDELFTYAYTGIATGEYEYYFKVTVNGQTDTINDQYNPYTKNGHSVLQYKESKLNIETSVVPAVVNYDQNAVLSVNITAITGSVPSIKEIYADLTELGGPAKSPVSTLSGEGTVYVSDSVVAGEKTIPVVVVDEYGVEHETTTKITVATKTTTDTDWDESVIYFLLTDRFFDGDAGNNGDGYFPEKAEARHGGDFAGLTSKLDYLKDLGINTIWITPIVENIDECVNEEMKQYAYHGYWAKDFTKVDKHLGSMEEFDTLLDEAHARGMKLMVDIVVNHAGYGTESVFNDMIRPVPGSDNLTLWLSDLPDFETENPAVRAKLVEWQTAWAAHTTASGNKIDYYRVDTVKHVEHDTWQALKTSLTKANPAFKMIGEYFGASVHDNGEYLGDGQMDSLLDFDFKSIAKNFINGSLESAEAALEERNSKLTNYNTMGQFLSSHDEDGFLYGIGDDTAKMKVASALQITAKGQPVIYYGEEINLTGPNSWGVFNNNRYDMQWDNLSEEQQQMYNHYKTLLKIRSDYSKVFAKGDRNKLAGSDAEKYMVFNREYQGDNVVVGLNTADTAVSSEFAVGFKAGSEIIDVYNNKTYVVDADGKINIEIPASKDGGTSVLVANEHVVTVVCGEGGKANITTQTVKAGDSLALEFTADDGYKVKDVLVDGISVGALSAYTLENIRKSHVVEVSFQKNEEPETESQTNEETTKTEEEEESSSNDDVEETTTGSKIVKPAKTSDVLTWSIFAGMILLSITILYFNSRKIKNDH